MIIGVTGSFGSGKSTVARMFGSLGAKVIDADRIARRLIRPKTKIYKKIIDSFGREILKANFLIDRHKLADIVFNNSQRLNRLNGIIHPEVIRVIKNQIKTGGPRTVVLDAPLLIEAGLAGEADKIVVVKLNSKEQIRRLLNDSSMSKSEILKRIKAQMSLRHKIRLADFVIDNAGTVRQTKKQVIKIWEKLQPQKGGRGGGRKWKNWISAI